MSINFPGNPWADERARVSEDTAGIVTSLNLLSFEQRTSTLVNLFGALTQTNRPVPHGLFEQIKTRLGIEAEG